MTSGPAVVAITGATSGIGLATASLLASRGVHLALMARGQERLASVEQEIRGDGAEVVTVAGDVGRPEDLERFAAATAERFDGVDGLFCNAGVAPFGSVPDLTPDEIDACLAVNVRGSLLAVQQFLPRMREGGAVLLTGSALHRRPLPETSLWSASAAAVTGMARALAVDLAPHGVRVNAISHGPIDTPAYEAYGMPPEAVAATKEAMASGTLLGRMGTSQAVAELAAALLLGPGTDFVTGTEVVADGGWALMPPASDPDEPSSGSA